MGVLANNADGNRIIDEKPKMSNDGLDTEKQPFCAGCSLRIDDAFVVRTAGLAWHSRCLRCAACGTHLENHRKCFRWENAIYCANDFLRLSQMSFIPCHRCRGKISWGMLALEARNMRFHVGCFRCATCDVALQKHDLFGVYDNLILCQAHYQSARQEGHVRQAAAVCSPDHNPMVQAPGGWLPMAVEPPVVSPHYGCEYTPPSSTSPTVGPQLLGEQWYHQHGDYAIPASTGPPFAYCDNNALPKLKPQRGRKKRKVETLVTNTGYLECQYAPGSIPGMNPSGMETKTKRSRTSFTPHQLRTMRAHFQNNRNPDSRELKMLSDKTGLDKKVLQVWFQNMRAKSRRIDVKKGQKSPASSSLQAGPSHDGDAMTRGKSASPDSDSSGGVTIQF